MALHRAQDRLMPTLNGNVLKTGGSLDLAKGQFGVFEVENVTRNGLKTLTAADILSLDQRDRIQLRLGKHENSLTRTRDNKNEESRVFRVGDIEKIEVFAPSTKKKVDDIIIGYNGQEGSEITLEKGDNHKINITISGRTVGMLGTKGSTYSFDIYLTKEDEETTNQEIVEKAVEYLNNNTYVADMIPITEFLEITPVNSENTTLDGEDRKFYHLEVVDSGDSNALGQLQSQYQERIVRTGRKGLTSTYTLIGEETPEDYVVEAGQVLADCGDCPEGYTPDNEENPTFCTKDETEEFSWTTGETCKVTTEEYSLVLADDECGEDRLEDLQEFYPDLTIAKGESFACQTEYTTEVTSEMVCEECDPMFQALFVTEAPEDFGFTSWVKAEKEYNPEAKMGIRIKGKDIMSTPSEFFKDDVPFINSSIHVTVAGGQPWATSSSYKTGTKGGFAVKVLSRAADLSNLGGDMWPLEQRDRTYFNKYSNRSQNTDSVQAQFDKFLNGRESVLDANTQYVIYSIKVNVPTRTQGFNKVLNEGFFYNISAPIGQHADIEEIVNALAEVNGLDEVEVYA